MQRSTHLPVFWALAYGTQTDSSLPDAQRFHGVMGMSLAALAITKEGWQQYGELRESCSCGSLLARRDELLNPRGGKNQDDRRNRYQ